MLSKRLPEAQCPACEVFGMRLLSGPRPEYVVQCTQCNSTFFEFGVGEALSHNNLYSSEAEYQGYLGVTNESSLYARHGETLDRLTAMLGNIANPRLFDVGAGAGDFLLRARARGFNTAGNEVPQPAIDACRQRNGIELKLGNHLHGIASDTGR